MLKRILLVLILVCFLGTFAFAHWISRQFTIAMEKDGGYPSMTEALKYATTGVEKPLVHCTGHCYCLKKDYARARTEYAKVLAMTNADPRSKAIAQLQIGHCYRKEGKDAEAQEAYLKLCLEQASTKYIYGKYIKAAFNRLDPLKIGKEKYLEVLDALISGIKAPENDEFLRMLKSKQKELKQSGLFFKS